MVCGVFNQESKPTCFPSKKATTLACEVEIFDMCHGHIHCILQAQDQIGILPIEHVWGSTREVVHLVSSIQCPLGLKSVLKASGSATVLTWTGITDWFEEENSVQLCGCFRAPMTQG